MLKRRRKMSAEELQPGIYAYFHRGSRGHSTHFVLVPLGAEDAQTAQDEEATARADMLLKFARQVILTITAAISGSRENRDWWTRVIGFDRLAVALNDLDLKLHPVGPECLVSWFIWMAIEYMPARDDRSDPLADIHPKQALNPSSTVLPRSKSAHLHILGPLTYVYPRVAYAQAHLPILV
jgi:hypothetical protein